MIDWASERASIAKDFAEDGTPSTLKRTTSTYNKRTDRTTKTVVNAPCYVIISDEEIADDQGRLVTYTIATMTEEPHLNDELVILDKSYVITKAMAIAPGGVPILFSAVLNA